MTSNEQVLIRQFRRMLSEHRKLSNLNVDQLLSQLDDMELQSIKEGDTTKAIATEVVNGRKAD